MKIGAGKTIGAAMFAAGVAAIWLWPKPKAEVAEADVVRPVRSMVVSARAKLPEMRCPGRVRAGESRDMMFEVPGRLVEFKLNRGDSVKKGAVLAKLDTRDYEADVAKAEAEYESRKLSYERYTNALGKGGVSKDDVSKAEADFKTAKAQLGSRAARSSRLTTGWSRTSTPRSSTWSRRGRRYSRSSASTG